MLVYQMGKVGSKTVYESLRAVAFPHPLFHLHFISDDITRYRKLFAASGYEQAPIEFDLGDAIRGELRRPGASRCKVISLVRDPIAFTISDLFENPEFAKTNLRSSDGAIDPQKAAAYLTTLVNQPDTFDYVFDWFDRELKREFDIDVFAEPFPKDLGYARLAGRRADALVIRMEDLSRVGPEAIAHFLDLREPLKLVDTNVRKDPAYAWVLENTRLSQARLDQVYASRFVRHFYSDEAVNAFARKWAGD